MTIRFTLGDQTTRWLSNFSAYPVFGYPTTEHAYQAAKTMDLTQRARIRAARTPGEAKRLGRQVTLRPEWADEAFRIYAMEVILREKLRRHPKLVKWLKNTGDQELIEHAPWDAFWGSGPDGKGRNELGKLWMRIREEL